MPIRQQDICLVTLRPSVTVNHDMRFHEIIATIVVEDTTTTKPEKWETRFGRHQRQQAKRASARTKLDNAQAAADCNRRQAADKLAAANDRIATAKRALAAAKRPAG